jgi:AraC-like DNA-binding protein
MGTETSRDTATRSVDTIRPLASLLKEEGLDVGAWLSAANLCEDDLSNIERRITIVQSEGLADAALDLTGDPGLGLRVVERIGPGTADLFTYLAATSATGREAFERATRYVTVAGSDFRFTLEREGDLIVCRTDSATSEGRVGRFAAEVAVGMMVKLGRVVAGGNLPINEVWFRHEAPEYADQYDRVYELPIHFGKRCNALIGLYARLDNPLPRADSTLCDLLDEHAQALLDRLPHNDSTADRVRATIADELASGDPTAEHVSEALGMSPRTLRRRLKDEGTSHQQLLDGVRKELARSYLAEGKLGVAEVAFLLGFSDPSAFHKAFRRWTGRSPGEWLRERA